MTELLRLREVGLARLKLAVKLLTPCGHVVKNASWLCELVACPAALGEIAEVTDYDFPDPRK